MWMRKAAQRHTKREGTPAACSQCERYRLHRSAMRLEKRISRNQLVWMQNRHFRWQPIKEEVKPASVPEGQAALTAISTSK